MSTIKDVIELLRYRTRPDRPLGEYVSNHPNELELEITALLDEVDKLTKKLEELK